MASEVEDQPPVEKEDASPKSPDDKPSEQSDAPPADDQKADEVAPDVVASPDVGNDAAAVPKSDDKIDVNEDANVAASDDKESPSEPPPDPEPTEPEPEDEPAPSNDSNPDPEPEPESKPESKPESPESKTDPEPEPKPEPEPEPVAKTEKEEEWVEQDDNLKLSDNEQEEEDTNVQEHYSDVTNAAGGAVGLLMSGPEPEWKEHDEKISDDEQEDIEVQEHYTDVTDAAGGAVGLLMEGPQPTWKEEDDNLKISDDEQEVEDVQGHYAGVTDAAGGAVGLLMSGPEPEWKEADDTLKISDDEQEDDNGGALLVDEAKLTGPTSVIDLLMGTEDNATDIKVGTRFQMGSLYYSVDSVSEYVVCVQIEALKATGFPTEVLLEPSQFAHVKVMSDEDYDAAVTAYTPIDTKDNDDDKKESVLSVDKDVEIGLKEGDRFNMGDVLFEIESMGDTCKCKRIQQDDNSHDTFPSVIYLARKQLLFVQKVEDTQDSVKVEETKSPSDAKSKIAMFEKKPSVKPEKQKPKVNKLKKNALNAKFAGMGMKINPQAMKPGAVKIVGNRERDGTLDQVAKVGQATIQRGKRKRKRKKVHVNAVSQAEQEIEKLVAPRLFLDEKAIAKEKAEQEKAEKVKMKAEKAQKKGKTAKAATGGKSGKSYEKTAREEPDPDEDDDRQPANSGGCCLVM